jgi:aldehyde:ferredoxin oxidoreductase
VALDRAEGEGALREYFTLAGWDTETGLPTAGTLKRLGLEWAI